jgi:hypothetical protein
MLRLFDQSFAGDCHSALPVPKYFYPSKKLLLSF